MKLLSKLLIASIATLSFSNEVKSQIYSRRVAPDYIPRIQYTYFSSTDAENTLSGFGFEGRAIYKGLFTTRMGFNIMNDQQTDETAFLTNLVFDIPINSEPDRSGYYITGGINFLFYAPEDAELQVTVGTGVPRFGLDETKEKGLGDQFAPQLGFGGQIMLLRDIIYIYANGNYLFYDNPGGMFTAGIDIRIPH